MNAVIKHKLFSRAVIGLIVAAILIGGGWYFLDSRDAWPRGEALSVALRPVIEGKDADQALVAGAILGNYREARDNAKRWSGIYWGFTFAAAVLSALAALVLKLETPLFRTDASKKDIAALFSVATALLVTISTSGDFQRKWQANRTAAAEFERTGYQFLGQAGASPRAYLVLIGEISERRHLSILGTASREAESVPPSSKDTAGGASNPDKK